MRILLASSELYGTWLLLRLAREGHACDWIALDPEYKEKSERILSGLIPPPLKKLPKFSDYQLVIFDSTGHGELADEARKETSVIGDGVLASMLEDDRLFGIETMEACGIEVPEYAVFSDPSEASAAIERRPKSYVYKPFSTDELQDCSITYVSDSAEDLLKCIDKLFADSGGAPFLLQEVVQGVECATNGYFDGQNFHFVTHTIEEKKFMSGGHGPNTGCAGNLIVNPRGAKRLVSVGLAKLTPFLRDAGYRGPIDLNSIVNEHHVFGIEFTPRFGYDSSATEFALLDGNLGEFLLQIAAGPTDNDPVPEIPYDYAAAERYSIPPYPCEIPGSHPEALPIKGVALDDAWKNFYLYDAMLDGEGLCTAGISGFVGCAIARAHTACAAWEGVERIAKDLHVPNLQVRDDLKESTLDRLRKVELMGWV